MLDFVHRPQSPRLLIEQALLATEAPTEAPSIALLRVRIVRSNTFTNLIGPRYANAVLNVAIERVKSALHGDDSLLRLDKDELAILLNPIASVVEAEQVANEIITLLERPYFCRGNSARLQVAIGIALSPQDGTDAETLSYCAETALQYAAVSRATSAVAYHNDLEAGTNSRLALAADLADALERSQLKLYYQPQFSLDRAQVLGFQASPQWRHPRYGWIAPSDFFPLAEELGVLPHISAWALRTACIQAGALQPQPAIAVAACHLQFTSGTMLASVEAALSTGGLRPEKLAIELPAQILLNRAAMVESTIASLHNMGIKLVLANVGSSFSALDLLGRIPFSSITLDAALVGQSSRQRSIVRAAAMLGQELGISTLAQGIETEQDLREARMDGCTSVQGSLMGTIVPAARIADVVNSLAA